MSRRAIAIWCASLAFSVSAGAQRLADVPRARPFPTDVTGVAPTRLAALVASGVPRGLVTVLVPLPPSLQDADEVSFEVRMSGQMEVLGRLVGVISSRGAQARPIVLTMRVPAEADAGTLAAAEVLFRASDGREMLVPILVQVSLVREVSVTGPREMRGLRSGDRVELAYRLFNAGNGPDTLRIDLDSPRGWTARAVPSGVVIVPPRRPLEVVVHVSVPPTTNVGDYPLIVQALDVHTGELVASAFSTLGLTGRGGSAAGLVLRSTVASTATSQGNANFTGFMLEGPVAAGAFLRAQLNGAVGGSGMQVQGLTSVGASNVPFSATLSGQWWDVAAGNTGTQLSELTGVNVTGVGVSATADGERWGGRLIAARPAVGADVNGSLGGLAVSRHTNIGQLSASVAQLTENGGAAFGRELQAVGLELLSSPLPSIALQSAVAQRSFVGGSGLGYLIGTTHTGERSRATVRYAHAPGGSAAFARSTDEVQFDVARELTRRLSVDAAYTAAQDASNVFSASSSGSWGMGSRFALTPSTMLSLRVSETSFDVRTKASTIGGFGARDQNVEAGWDWRSGVTSVSVDAGAARIERSTQLADGRASTAVAQQRTLRGTVSHPTERFGTFDGSAGLDFTEAGVGIPGRAYTVSTRWSGVPFSIGDRQVRMNADAMYQKLGGLQSALVTRATAIVGLPLGLEMAVSGERNPFFRDERGRAGWIGALRLSASTKVFTPKALGPVGVVFEDANLNGRRDDGEVGVAGVVVRRGDARATTGRDGTYRLPASARGRTRLDQASIPIGLIAHPLLAADALERLDIPVLPTGRVTVSLALVADEDGRVPQVSLEPAVVVLKDATGFEWVGRKSSPTTAEFDGIPVGRYELSVNVTRLTETLRPPVGQVVDVESRAPQQVRAELRGRIIRRFVPGGQSGNPVPPRAGGVPPKGSQ
jgi:hypothetical protein